MPNDRRGQTTKLILGNAAMDGSTTPDNSSSKLPTFCECQSASSSHILLELSFLDMPDMTVGKHVYNILDIDARSVYRFNFWNT